MSFGTVQDAVTTSTLNAQGAPQEAISSSPSTPSRPVDVAIPAPPVNPFSDKANCYDFLGLEFSRLIQENVFSSPGNTGRTWVISDAVPQGSTRLLLAASVSIIIPGGNFSPSLWIFGPGQPSIPLADFNDPFFENFYAAASGYAGMPSRGTRIDNLVGKQSTYAVSASDQFELLNPQAPAVVIPQGYRILFCGIGTTVLPGSGGGNCTTELRIRYVDLPFGAVAKL